MKLVVHSTDLRIALHPSQKQTLADLLPKLALNWPNFSHVELVEDETLSPGGCRIFTRQGMIDADLGEQLNRIAADLLPSAESAASSPPPSFPSPGASPGEGGGEGARSA
jgi:flagellar biosynthesis/type III secretory pathway protein FliH